MEQYKKTTVSAYDLNMTFFEKKFQEQFEKYGAADVDAFVSQLKGNKILDIGCGPGIYLEAFRERGLDALGIDLSEAFVARCAEKGLNVRKMDMEYPVLYPHSFDGLWAHAVLQHVPKERAADLVKGWARLLKTDGLLWTAFRKGQGDGFEELNDLPGHKRWISHYSDAEIRALFSKYFDVLSMNEHSPEGGRPYWKYVFQVKPLGKPLFYQRP